MLPDAVLEADRAFAAGRLDDAATICRSVLQSDPDSFPALLTLGIVLARRGDFQNAVPVLERADRCDPGTGKPAVWLSRALRHLNRSSEALPYAVRAAQFAPQDLGAIYQLGMCCLDEGDYERACACFFRVTESDSSAATVHHALGLALQALGRSSEALGSFSTAATLAPSSLPILESLFEAYVQNADSDGAVEAARTMLRLNLTADSHLRLARAQLMNNDSRGATDSLEAAKKSSVADGSSLFSEGLILRGLGRIQEAALSFERSIELEPEFGPDYSALVYMRKTGEGARPLAERIRLLADRADISLSHRSHLHYAAGRLLEGLEEYVDAMFHYDEANRLASEAALGPRAFDRDLFSAHVEEALSRHDALRFSAGSESEQPVFVIGMLRSGTTLVEQILSSHREVGSVGEQGFWIHASRQECPPLELSEAYLEKTKRACPGSRLVVDKMPDNYRVAPLIHAALPRARFIHVLRNPADTCLSIYTTINRRRIDWSHDKEDIAFVYRQYRRLMERWREILPAETMLEISYEELVSDQERVTRRLVSFCGLEWDPACLNPELNQSSVTTPSAWQVRQPVYTSSVGRWRLFEPWISPFVELLGSDARP